MKTTNPIIHEEKEYNDYAVSLASSFVPRSIGITQGANLTLTPVRLAEDGSAEFLNEPSKVIRFASADIANCGDPDILEAYTKIVEAIEVLKTKKGW